MTTPIKDRFGLTADELRRIERESPTEQVYQLARKLMAAGHGPGYANLLALSECPAEDLADRRRFAVRFPLVLTALDTLIADLTAQYEAHRVDVGGGMHGGADGVNTVAGAGGDPAWTAASATTRYAQLAALRTVFEAHRIRVAGAVHAVADAASFVPVPTVTANDIIGAFILANALKTSFAAHWANATSHGVADTTNVVTAAAATQANSVDTTETTALYEWNADTTTLAYSERDYTFRHSAFPAGEAGRFVLAGLAPKAILEGMDPSRLQTVANLAASKALAAADMPNYGLVQIATLGLYRVNTASAATADDVEVIRPTCWAASNGRLIREAPADLAAWANLTATMFVDGTLGSDVTGNGSIGKPYATIQAAITAGGNAAKIIVAPGTYTEDVTMTQGSTLYLDEVSLNGTLTVSTRPGAIHGGQVVGLLTLTHRLDVYGTILTGGASVGNGGKLYGFHADIGGALTIGHATADVGLTGGSVAGAVTWSAAGTLRSTGVAYAAAVTVGFAAGEFYSDGDTLATTFGASAAGAIAHIDDAKITGIVTVDGAGARVVLDACVLIAALVLSGVDARVRGSKTAFGGAATLTNSADIFLDDCDVTGAFDVGAASVADLTNCRLASTATVSGAAGVLRSRGTVYTGAVDLGAANAEFHSAGDVLLATLDLGGGPSIAHLVDTAVAGITTADGAADRLAGFGSTFTGNFVHSGAAARADVTDCIFGALVTLTNAALLSARNCSIAGAVDVGAASLVDFDACRLASTVTVTGANGTVRGRHNVYTGAVDLNAANAELGSSQDVFSSTLDIGAAACLARLSGSSIAGAYTQDGAAALVEADEVVFTGAVAVSAGSILKAGKCRFSSTLDLLTASELFLADCNVAGAVTQGADTTILHASGCVFVGALTSSGANGVAKLSQCELPAAGANRIVLSGASRIDINGCDVTASGNFAAVAVSAGNFQARDSNLVNNWGAGVCLDGGVGGVCRLYGGRITNAGGGGTGDLSNAATTADPNILDGVTLSGGPVACAAVPTVVKGIVRLGAAADYDADMVTGTALIGTPGEYFAGPLAAPGAAMHAAYPGGGAVNDAVGPWTLPLPRRTVQLSLAGGGAPGSYVVTGTVDGKVVTDTIGPTVAGGTVQGRIAFDAITSITGPDPVANLTMETGNGFGVGGPVLQWGALSCDGAVEAMVTEDEAAGSVQPTTAPNAAHVYVVTYQR